MFLYLIHCLYRLARLSYLDFASVEWTPDASNTLVEALHRPTIQLPVLLSRAIPQHFRLFPYTLVLKVLDTYRPLGTVDVVCNDYGVVSRPWADGDFNLRIALCEGRQRGLEEGVHAPGGAPPVAIVEG